MCVCFNPDALSTACKSAGLSVLSEWKSSALKAYVSSGNANGSDAVRYLGNGRKGASTSPVAMLVLETRDLLEVLARQEELGMFCSCAMQMPSRARTRGQAQIE